MTHIDHALQLIELNAIRTASRNGAPVAIYNLNSSGKRLLVIRAYDPDAPAPYVGPFQPLPKWQAEFPEWRADTIPALGSDWTDSSWHNDACPSFIHEPSGVLLWCGDGPDGGDYEFIQMQADSVNGWQHGPIDGASLLHCDTIGEVRDVLDHAAHDGCTLHEALQYGRMRLNQLTVTDARAFIADNHSARCPCPDLHAAMMEIIAAEGGAA
jgi:hypothetical protein